MKLTDYLKTLLAFVIALTINLPSYAQSKIRWNTAPTYANTPEEVAPDPDEPQPLEKITPQIRHNAPLNQKVNSPIPSTSVSQSTTPTNIANEEEQLNQDIRLLWDEINQMEKNKNDITVLPIKPIEKTHETKNTHKNQNTKTPAASIKSEQERIETLLRNSKEKNSKIIIQSKEVKNDKNDKTDKNKTPAPVVTLPTAQPKPVLTRKQVLEHEIEREKAALKSAQTQLKIAQKRGNTAQATKLLDVIRDRQLNVQAISRELSR